jgi:chromosome segregation ATPase
MAATSQYTQLRDMMGDIKEEITSAINRLDSRLNVHDQKHVQLDTEHQSYAQTLNLHADKIAAVERLAAQTERDVSRLTVNINKLAWAIATPLIGLIVLTIIGLLQR